MKERKIAFVTFITSLFILFFIPYNLTAEKHLFSCEDKEQALISHVKISIANAEKGISKLNWEILALEGMSSSIIRHFLNNICSLQGAHYLEIGCWKGSTLISAAYKNQERLAEIIAIDNWSQFGGPKNEFLENVKWYLPTAPLKFYEADCFDINKSAVFHQPINIYFYDGNNRFMDHKQAFTYYDQILDDAFIAIVDDWNWEDVRNGTIAAFNELKYQILFEKFFFTPYTGDPSSWWNGFYIAVVKKTKS